MLLQKVHSHLPVHEIWSLSQQLWLIVLAIVSYAKRCASLEKYLRKYHPHHSYYMLSWIVRYALLSCSPEHHWSAMIHHTVQSTCMQVITSDSIVNLSCPRPVTEKQDSASHPNMSSLKRMFSIKRTPKDLMKECTELIVTLSKHEDTSQKAAKVYLTLQR
jgi:hypothetical protein